MADSAQQQQAGADMLATPAAGPGRPMSRRKRLLLEQAEQLAPERDDWAARHRYYYEEEWRYLRFLVPPGKRVLVLGCGNGHVLNALAPSSGVGVDFSSAKIERAKNVYPKLTFLCGDVENMNDALELQQAFDVIVMPDTVGSLDDCLATFQKLHRYCNPETRLVVSYYTRLWDPLMLAYAKFASSRRFVRCLLYTSDAADEL